jgi:multiple sugar transport system substrate-binding protein
VSRQRERSFRIAVRRFGPFEKAIEAQWSAFEAQARTGLNLDLVALDLHPLEQALFPNGMANGEWDVAFVATDWVPAMHRLGCAVDLAPYLRDDPPQDWPQGWTPSLRRLQAVGEQVLGVPYHDGPECLVVRRDLFEGRAEKERYRALHGEELRPPRTWEEFHRVARYFHRPDEGLYGTAFAAYPDGHNSVYDFLLQVWTRGGEVTDEAGRLTLDTPEAEAALTFYRAMLADEGAVHPRCDELDSVQLGACFAAGELAMMVNWFGFAAVAHADAGSRVPGRVDVAPLPCGVDGCSVSLNVYWTLAIGAGSPHREAAWKFLRHTLRPEMDLLTSTSGAIGCRRSTWADAQLNRSLPFYGRMEELHAVAREVPRREDWPQIACVIDRLVTQTITTSRPIGELLREAQQGADDLPK